MSEQTFSRRAEWIWRPRQLDEPAFATEGFRVGEKANRYVYFRLTIQVPGTVTSANSALHRPTGATASMSTESFVGKLDKKTLRNTYIA